MKYKRPYRALQTGHWIVETHRTTRSYRHRWMARVAAFFVQNSERLAFAMDLWRRGRVSKQVGRAVRRHVHERQDRPSAALMAGRRKWKR